MRAWQRLGTRKVYEDSWIRVRVDKIVFPRHNISAYTVIELKGGVGIVVLDAKKRILLVGQYRYAIQKYSWEIPKGSLPKFRGKQQPLISAMRELREEAGVIGKKWKKLGLVHTLIGSTNDRVYLYSARYAGHVPSEPEDSEEIQAQWVSVSAFWRLVRQARITDATSIAAVAWVTRNWRPKQ